MKEDSQLSFGSNLKADLPASIVVFLVALPLCLGISLASGAPPISGVIAGVIGGIVVGFFSGSALGVSGPAAGLAAIVAADILALGSDFRLFLVVVVLAGIMQLLFGILKAGVIADYFPSNVIKGMLAAIGVTLFLKQIPHGLGYDKDAIGNDAYRQADGHNTFTEIFYALQSPHFGAIIIAIISVGILLLWQQGFFKKNKILSLIPAPLVVVVGGVLLNQFYSIYIPSLELTGNHLVNISLGGEQGGFFQSLTSPDFSFITVPVSKLDGFSQAGLLAFDESLDWDLIKQLFGMAFTIAVVASLETLLSVEASDKLDPLKRITPTDKELVAQGIGNVLSGLIGGLPITQVIVRSSANVNSGGRTKFSAIIHGLLLLLSVLTIPFVLNKIPLACLAGILLVIGYKLASVKLFQQMYLLKSRQFVPFVLTVVAILVTNLLDGITIGLIISIYFILQNNRTGEPFEVKFAKSGDIKTKGYLVDIILHEEVNYLSKNILMMSLHDIPKDSHIVIDGTNSRFIANDIIEAISEFEESVASRKNITIEFKIKEDRLGKIDQSALDGLSSL